MEARLRAVEETALGGQLDSGEIRADAHRATTTGTAPGVRVGIGWSAGLTWFQCESEKLTGETEASGAAAIGEKPELTNTHESAGQNVLKKPPQELGTRQRHLPLFVAVRIVLPAERYSLSVESQ